MKIAAIFILFLATIPVLAQDSGDNSGISDTYIPPVMLNTYNNVLVKEAFNGGMLQLENGEMVILLGVYIPQFGPLNKYYKGYIYTYAERTGKDVEVVQNMARQTYELLKQLCEDKRVRLEFDVQPRDKKGRLLAYVYLADGTFVNAELIKQGYAVPKIESPNTKYADLFLQLYQEAQQNKVGFWNAQ